MDDLVLRAGQRRRLESQLRRTHDVRVYQRTLAVLERGRGRTVAEIARMLCVSRQSVYRWLEAYGESMDPETLVDDGRSGRPRRWSEKCSVWLESFLRHSPAELGYAAVNWTTPLLRHAMARCTGQVFCGRTVRRELQHSGYVWKRPRYVLLPDPDKEKKTPNSSSNQAFVASLCSAC